MEQKVPDFVRDSKTLPSRIKTCLNSDILNSQQIISALEQRQLDENVIKCLFTLAWSLDAERAATLTRMRQGHA